ncbi:MAG: MiaB/RimO family radical SAM methylthiotransferase [Phycisphaerales bacterium]|nr:MiaB/RimO family radical SAM methylthiotransferase [Phycisphaerales bacterium]
MHQKTVYLETFGCQMNELDSELVQGQLEALGYRFTPDDTRADIVLYNTCSVREQAENKALSRVGIISQRKRDGADLILGVLGCMAERDGKDMIRRHPQIDLMCGPSELDRLPLLLDNVAKARASEQGQATLLDRVALAGSRSRRSTTLGAAEDSLELLDLSRAFSPDLNGKAAGRSAYVRITRGCNKFCTYCVVPHTRGAEVHRPPSEILAECRQLAEKGVLEVTLLGQTVNHYCYTHGTALSMEGRELAQVGPGLKAFRGGSTGTNAHTTSFADLLQRIHEEVPELQRIRFVTSYPRDFGDDILDVIAASPRICPYLHVPAQSGSNRMLKLMNRGYTVEEYLEFIDRAIKRVPDVSIAGDIIVGFPGETDEDFQATVNLLRQVPFKNNFIFKYSPRPGTVAIDRFEDDIPDPIKRERNNLLLAVQAEVSEAVHARWVGREVDVLVEQVSKRDQERPNRPLKSQEGDSGGVTLTAHGKALADHANGDATMGSVRHGTENPKASQDAGPVQLSGRTGGDLITFFNSPSGIDPGELIGTIQKVRVHESGVLSLSGTLQSQLPGTLATT